MTHKKIDKTSENYLSLAHKFKHEGQWENAVKFYQNAIEIDPNLADAYHYLGDIFLSQEKWELASYNYQKVIQLEPESFWSNMNLGDAFYGQTKYNEAIIQYQLACQLNPSFFWPYLQLGKALIKIGSLDKAIELLSHSLTLEAKNNRDILYYLWVAFAQMEKWDVALDYFQKINLPLANLVEILIIRDHLKEAVNTYQYLLKLQPDSEKYYTELSLIFTESNQRNKAIENYQLAIEKIPECQILYFNLIWLLSQRNRWDEALNYYDHIIKNKPDQNKINEMTLSMQTSNIYKHFRLHNLNTKDRDYLENRGLSISFLESMQVDNQQRKELLSFVQSSLCDSSSDTTYICKHRAIPEFQYQMLDHGYIETICPFTGDKIKSNQSFYISLDNYLIFYRFVSQEVFYFLIGGWPTLKVGIYLPDHEIIISFGHQDGFIDEYSNRGSLETCVNTLKIYTICCLESVKNYIANNHSKVNGCALAFHTNIGHYFWNEVSAIVELYDNKKIQNISYFIMGYSNHFLDIRTILPELSIVNSQASFLNISEEQPGYLLFELCLRKNIFAIHLSALMITEKLASRIYHNSLQKCEPCFLRQVGELKKSFPLIGITIRSHRRAWLSQVEGIANIINELYKEYPNLGVIFDGTKTEQTNLELILGKISCNVKTYNALNCNNKETIILAHAMDLYIGSYGAGTIFTSIANKPGVLHANTCYCGEEPKYFCINPRENCLPITIVPIGAVVDSVDSEYNHQHSRNYDCDWKIIYDLVIEIVKKLP